ncbi:hypothetical protein D3C80_647480 [compost metagenome]
MQFGDSRTVFGLHHIGVGVDLLPVEAAAGGEFCLRCLGISLASGADFQRFEGPPGKDCAFRTQGDVEIRRGDRATGFDCKIGNALGLRCQLFESGEFARQAGVQRLVFEADIACRLYRAGFDGEVLHADAPADGQVDIALQGDCGVEFFRQCRRQGGRQREELHAGCQPIAGEVETSIQRSADAGAFQRRAVKADGGRGEAERRLDGERCPYQPVDIRADEGRLRHGEDGCDGAAAAGNVEIGAFGHQLDVVKPALWQGKAAQ